MIVVVVERRAVRLFCDGALASEHQRFCDHTDRINLVPSEGITCYTRACLLTHTTPLIVVSEGRGVAPLDCCRRKMIVGVPRRLASSARQHVAVRIVGERESVRG